MGERVKQKGEGQGQERKSEKRKGKERGHHHCLCLMRSVSFACSAHQSRSHSQLSTPNSSSTSQQERSRFSIDRTQQHKNLPFHSHLVFLPHHKIFFLEKRKKSIRSVLLSRNSVQQWRSLAALDRYFPT
jgi:hypothetical protein